MLLIIDSYTTPHYKIQARFHLQECMELNEPDITLNNLKSKSYFIHKELINDIKIVRYYFNEIYEVLDSKLYYYNKRKSTRRVFDIINKSFVEVKTNSNSEPDVAKKGGIIPYLSTGEGKEGLILDIDDEEL